MSAFFDENMKKIKNLNETIWRHVLNEPLIREWLNNFTGLVEDSQVEQEYALYLLSHFIYFSTREIRELLISLFRDLYKYPIVKQIRLANGDITDNVFIQQKFSEELAKTKFLGMGNPAESGCHLLYYFRQENALSRELFMHGHQIFLRDDVKNEFRIRNENIKRYVFLDDFCGSGTQGIDFTKDILKPLKTLAPKAIVDCYLLFATADGLNEMRKKTLFDNVEAVCILDKSYKCFDMNSRYFNEGLKNINRADAQKIISAYGQKLFPKCPLGYKNGQLILGFEHNIPDNTLPIMWCNSSNWTPAFKRYQKIY